MARELGYSTRIHAHMKEGSLAKLSHGQNESPCCCVWFGQGDTEIYGLTPSLHQKYPGSGKNVPLKASHSRTVMGPLRYRLCTDGRTSPQYTVNLCVSELVCPVCLVREKDTYGVCN